MASEVQICNEALNAIGVNPILSLTDNTKAARTCNLIYDDKRDELLRSFEWTFATRRISLAPLSTAPAFGWDYQFNLPSDCLKLLYVGTEDGIRYSYSIEENKILVDYDTIYIKYTRKVVDPDQFDSLFRAALALYIAQYVAVPLGARSEYTKCVEDYEEKLSQARFAGSIEMDYEQFEGDDWLESRV